MAMRAHRWKVSSLRICSRPTPQDLRRRRTSRWWLRTKSTILSTAPSNYARSSSSSLFKNCARLKLCSQWSKFRSRSRDCFSWPIPSRTWPSKRNSLSPISWRANASSTMKCCTCATRSQLSPNSKKWRLSRSRSPPNQTPRKSRSLSSRVRRSPPKMLRAKKRSRRTTCCPCKLSSRLKRRWLQCRSSSCLNVSQVCPTWLKISSSNLKTFIMRTCASRTSSSSTKSRLPSWSNVKKTFRSV